MRDGVLCERTYLVKKPLSQQDRVRKHPLTVVIACSACLLTRLAREYGYSAMSAVVFCAIFALKGVSSPGRSAIFFQPITRDGKEARCLHGQNRRDFLHPILAVGCKLMLVTEL